MAESHDGALARPVVHGALPYEHGAHRTVSQTAGSRPRSDHRLLQGGHQNEHSQGSRNSLSLEKKNKCK